MPLRKNGWKPPRSWGSSYRTSLNGTGRGEEKKAYVVKFLQEKGFTLDPDSLDKLIEAAVFNLPEYIGLIETEGKPDTD